jgi:hypothetical protein
MLELTLVEQLARYQLGGNAEESAEQAADGARPRVNLALLVVLGFLMLESTMAPMPAPMPTPIRVPTVTDPVALRARIRRRFLYSQTYGLTMKFAHVLRTHSDRHRFDLHLAWRHSARD